MSQGKLLTTISSLCAFDADKAETCGHPPIMYSFSCILAHANLCVEEVVKINTAHCFGLCDKATPKILSWTH